MIPDNLDEKAIRRIVRDEIKKFMASQKKKPSGYDLNKVASFLGKRKLK